MGQSLLVLYRKQSFVYSFELISIHKVITRMSLKLLESCPPLLEGSPPPMEGSSLPLVGSPLSLEGVPLPLGGGPQPLESGPRRLEGGSLSWEVGLDTLCLHNFGHNGIVRALSIIPA